MSGRLVQELNGCTVGHIANREEILLSLRISQRYLSVAGHYREPSAMPHISKATRPTRGDSKLHSFQYMGMPTMHIDILMNINKSRTLAGKILIQTDL